MARVVCAPASDGLTAAQSRMQVLAEEFGGEYVGHGGLS
jgi:hypothetical protein